MGRGRGAAENPAVHRTAPRGEELPGPESVALMLTSPALQCPCQTAPQTCRREAHGPQPGRTPSLPWKSGNVGTVISTRLLLDTRDSPLHQRLVLPQMPTVGNTGPVPGEPECSRREEGSLIPSQEPPTPRTGFLSEPALQPAALNQRRPH